jgi:hypothetical protein
VVNTVRNNEPRCVDEIFLKVQQLTTQEKAELVTYLLNTMSHEQLPNLIDAIAFRIRNET